MPDHLDLSETSVELGWTDHDGDHGHIIVGDLTDYAGPVQPDTIAIIEARSNGRDRWTAVYLPLDIAETLHEALGRALTAYRREQDQRISEAFPPDARITETETPGWGQSER
jgi:hypothetical protein